MKRITLFLTTCLAASIALANGETYSTSMGLVIPTPGVTTGPAYANDINASLNIIDTHDHSPGNGVQITPAGMNISSDLTCADNNLTNIRAARFYQQSAPISATGSDLRQLYVSGADLYYNDGSGNQVRITQSGSVTGSAGTITGLPSGTASAAFDSGSGTFQFLQSTSSGANMDAGTYILRYPGSYPSPSGNYIAFQAPSSLATGYALTLPATLPGTTGFWPTSTTAGVLSWTGVDNSTLQYSANVVSIKSSGVGTAQVADSAITTAKIADAAVTRPKLAALGQQISSSSGAFATSSTSSVPVTNLSVTITTTGRLVYVGLIADGSGNLSQVGTLDGSSAGATITLQFVRGATAIAQYRLSTFAGGASSTLGAIPPSAFQTFDAPAAGTYTYSVNAFVGASSTGGDVTRVKLIAYEL